MKTELSAAYRDVMVLERPEGNLQAGICFFRLPDSYPLEEVSSVFHSQELTYYDNLKFEKRKKSYLVGRYAAKHALAALLGDKDLSNIRIDQGIFSQPIVSCDSAHNIGVSITHCDELGAAIAFPESHPMGIDIERVNKNKREVMESQLTDAEQKLISETWNSRDALLTLIWTVKEALSKVLKTGLTTPFHIFEIEKVESKSDHSISSFRNFGQYKATSFNTGPFVCSIVYPKKTDLAIDIQAVKKGLNMGSEE